MAALGERRRAARAASISLGLHSLAEVVGLKAHTPELPD